RVGNMVAGVAHHGNERTGIERPFAGTAVVNDCDAHGSPDAGRRVSSGVAWCCRSGTGMCGVVVLDEEAVDFLTRPILFVPVAFLDESDEPVDVALDLRQFVIGQLAPLCLGG